MYMVYNAFIKQHKKLLQFFGTFLSGLLIGIALVNLLCLFNIMDLNQKRYVYVDIAKVIESVNKTINKQVEDKRISDDQVTSKLFSAKTKFNQLLDSYIKEHNAIVFSSIKVIAGANDVTEYFIKKTEEEIK